jgi:4-hydroxy-tetrahydrodipicolinate synthase
MSLIQSLSGTGVAVITPFHADGEIDFDSYSRLLEFIIGNKVDYVVVLGTTGEAPVLSRDEKKRLIEHTYKIINGRVPVVVGIGGNNTREVVADLSEFPLGKATAILSVSPYYSKPSQEGIYLHYKAIAEASPVPVILYNVPGRTGRQIDSSTVLKLAHEVPNIAGIKEASGLMESCMDILKDCPADFLVVSGDDALALPQIACGMHGVISVAANCFPADFSEMIRHCLSKNFDEARVINEKLMPAYDLLFAENNPAGVKAFLTEMEIIKNNLRLPLVPLSRKFYQQVQEYISKISLLCI